MSTIIDADELKAALTNVLSDPSSFPVKEENQSDEMSSNKTPIAQALVNVPDEDEFSRRVGVIQELVEGALSSLQADQLKLEERNQALELKVAQLQVQMEEMKEMSARFPGLACVPESSKLPKPSSEAPSYAGVVSQTGETNASEGGTLKSPKKKSSKKGKTPTSKTEPNADKGSGESKANLYRKKVAEEGVQGPPPSNFLQVTGEKGRLSEKTWTSITMLDDKGNERRFWVLEGHPWIPKSGPMEGHSMISIGIGKNDLSNEEKSIFSERMLAGVKSGLFPSHLVKAWLGGKSGGKDFPKRVKNNFDSRVYHLDSNGVPSDLFTNLDGDPNSQGISSIHDMCPICLGLDILVPVLFSPFPLVDIENARKSTGEV